MRWALLGLLVVGCGGSGFTEEEGRLNQLWRVVFDGPGAAPHVEWVEGARLTCDPMGFGPGTGWEMVDGEGISRCVDGNTVYADYVQVARWPGMALRQSALAHEFAHAVDEARGRAPDWQHAGAAFQPGGAVEAGEAWLERWGSGPTPR